MASPRTLVSAYRAILYHDKWPLVEQDILAEGQRIGEPLVQAGWFRLYAHMRAMIRATKPQTETVTEEDE